MPLKGRWEPYNAYKLDGRILLKTGDDDIS